MNRQIKFRVWNGHSMEYRVLAGALGHFYVEGMSQKDSACLSDANTIYHESAPLMQFTGLLDKNGKEIWEGDIVKFWFEHEVPFTYISDSRFYIGEVVYLNYKFMFYNGCFHECNSKDIEVIGNIHANPELLK